MILSIINKEGALIAAGGSVDEARTLGAVLSTIWGDYDEAGAKVLRGAEEMDTFMLDCSSGRIVGGVMKSLALCVKGTGELGLLQETLTRLKEVLESQLLQVLEQLE